MNLQELKVGFEVDRIQLFLEKLEDPEIEWFWQAISNIHDVFPNIDIYLAGSVKGKGYIGFGIKPNVTENVKDFLLVSHLKNNDKGNYFFKLEVIQALADFIAEHDPKFSLNFSYKNLVTEKFADWLHKLKEYAIQFGMTLNGQGLLPLDYQNQSLTAAQAVEYLKERYPDTYSGTSHIATFKTSLGREIALDPGTKTPIIFCDAAPPVELNLKIKQIYSETDTRNQHLSAHAKSLRIGNKIVTLIINNQNDLEKLCNWYENDEDQLTGLENKVKAFLELWPIDRIKNLTIEDYHQANNQSSFIVQVDLFSPTENGLTMSNYYEIWQPLTLGKGSDYHNQIPYSWHRRFGDDLNIAFTELKQEILNIIEATKQRDLKAIDQIAFNASLKWMIAFLYQDFSDPFIIPIVTETNIKRIGYAEYVRKPLPEFLPILLADKGEQAFFPYVEKLFAIIKTHYWNNKKQKSLTKKDEVMIQQTLNRILFGAAGTGKTFQTINHALSIIENKNLEELEKEEREEIKKRFDEYKDQGQIKFVTFHQSFSYEDFVEGIRAETNPQGQLNYDVRPGVFKEICEDAQTEIDAKQNNELAPIEASINSVIDKLITQAKTEEMIFHTKRGAEIKVSSNSAGTLFALTSTGSNITLSIRHIRNYLKTQSAIIVDQKSYEWAIANSLRSKVEYTNSIEKVKPYVLIIDEINRGNISRIFGELITLIEDSKRQGADEELSVTLPYSKKEFSVPSNVYIIGTMNSSDRSLTGLDIALRRRFTFIEMPPKPELLNDVVVESLNIGELLKVINQRIEVLLDRDHCIGHANFMSLKEQPTREHLADIFKQKIIPQLQEYFFDDWAKINLVFFNNGMLIEDDTLKINSLFPSNFEQELGYSDEKKIWKINNKAFESVDAFILILGTKG